ncbi:hypothetical protein MMC19_002121 [Ptychographa xylographoides]|nr:hypothetical protein [Ptychographa xylographoides]
MDIAETNKIRVAIGLPPLPVPGVGPTFKPSNDSDSSSEAEDVGSTLESRQAEGYDNWKRLQDEVDAKARRDAKTDAVKKARDTVRKFAKLEGKGLGEADAVTELDTRSWLVQQKRRQKQLERQRVNVRKVQEELKAREAAMQYTAKDLAGVKVGHELGEFVDDGEHVLTLKDTTIDENEEDGDELENLDLREREKAGERQNLKRKKPIYDPNEVEEGGETGLLKQYDETIEGKKRKKFTLDAQGSTMEDLEPASETTGGRAKAQPISLDILKDLPTSDYLEVSDIKMRKQKKKKVKSTRQKPTDDDDIFPTEDLSNGTGADHEAMDIDDGRTTAITTMSRQRAEDVSFVDDDDLQASLAKQRREALKKRKKLKPEDIARQFQEEAMANENGGAENQEPVETGGLIIDETSEFVANLQRPVVSEKPRSSSTSKPNPTSPSSADGDGDVDMERSYNDIEDGGELAEHVKRESSDSAVNNLTVTGLEDESTLTNGIGATLSLLSQRGLINNEDKGDINALHRERQKFLAEKQKREAAAEQKARIQRERDRASGKLDRMSAREREEYARWENKQRDQAESRQMAEIFSREYKPDVQLKYVDEFGRSMNQKEAFKHLSHQFHGKGSGKQKTEKHLKKIEDEKKKEAQSSLDSSQATGMNNALGTTAKKNRQAGVRLA